ncbi:MAG: hypothetical protein JWQ49_5603 [Edaphobacter sp.]|nr:hypothetical protein [Edaphobacter sp.]
MERVESHNAGFPPSHTLWKSLRDSHITTATTTRYVFRSNLNLNPQLRKGLVTDVSGPKCNGCPGTLTPSTSFCKLYAHEFTHRAFFFHQGSCFCLRFPSGREPGGVQRQSLKLPYPHSQQSDYEKEQKGPK